MQTYFNRFVVFFVATCLSATAALAASDDFSTNPLAVGSGWSFGVGSNANNQFQWSPGALSVHLDSSLPSARLDLPLGITLNDSSSFEFSARFSFHVTSAPSDQAANMGFGLTNHALTGGDRTGSLANFMSDNTFHTIEWGYFPNVSPIFGGPTLTPVVFGGQEPAGDAFANFASIFGSASLLNDNTVGIKTLPQDTPLETRLTYDGTLKTLTLTMFQLVGNIPVLLNTELVSLELLNSSYDPAIPFHLDSMSVMAYFDGFTTAEAPSLIGDISFDSMTLVVPEPSGAMLAGCGTLICLALGWNRSRRRAVASRAALTGS